MMMKSNGRCFALAAVALCLATEVEGEARDLPPLIELRRSAESGDSKAQNELAEHYFRSFKYGTAAKWFQKPAEEGDANAQWRLGSMLIAGKAGIPSTEKVAASPDLAMLWLLKAGHRGHARAQVDLGSIYQAGRAVTTNMAEAFKWFRLATKQSRMYETLYLNPVILKMTPEQITEGQRRFADFRALPDSAVRSDWLLERIRLRGISQARNKRFALINGAMLAEGEEGAVLVAGEKVLVRCIAIRENSASVSIAGVKGDREIGLQ